MYKMIFIFIKNETIFIEQQTVLVATCASMLINEFKLKTH